MRELLRDLVKSLWWGELMRVPTDDVRYLDEEKHHEFAIAKLDQVIDLVAEIRMAWINSPESVHEVDHVAGRRLGQLTGDLTENEIPKCHNHWMNSLVWMTDEKRRQYNYLKQQQEEINKKKARPRGKARGSSTRRARAKRNVLRVQGSRLISSRRRASTSIAFKPAGASSSSSLSCVSPRS